MRHERSAQASGVEQMFFEGERHVYKVIDRATEKVVASSDYGHVEVKDGVAVTKPHGSGNASGSAHSMVNVRIEGDVVHV